MYDMVIADAISLATTNFELGYEEDEKEAAYNALLEVIAESGEAFEAVASKNGLMYEAARWLINNPRVALGALQEVVDGIYYGSF